MNKLRFAMAMKMATRVLRCILLHSLPMGIFAISSRKANPLTKFQANPFFKFGSTISNKPYPELIEHKYLKPEGSGCGERGNIPGLMRDSVKSWLKEPTAPASAFYRARTEEDRGWNGFCEMGWSLCPDAVANEDYSYYWRGLGPQWVRNAGSVDKLYCLNNGWLKPEIASIVRNFTALKTKGEQLCKTKYDAPELKQDKLGLFGGLVKGTTKGMANKMAAFARGDTHYSLIDEESSAIFAAWNCALGDVSCDIAYCNYAYCELPDGTAGVMDECEGWDSVKGMPALYK